MGIISGGHVIEGSGTNAPLYNAGAPSAGVSAVQTVTASGTVSGGTYTISYRGRTTTALAFGATAATIQAALVALPSIGAGGVTVTGGPLPATPATITFAGPNAAIALPLVTVNSQGLTGGGSYVVTSTTAGVNATGRGAARGALLIDTTNGALYQNKAVPPAVSWGTALSREAEEAPDKARKK